jgi:hypothetical protein
VRVGAGAAAGLLMTLALAACGVGGTQAASSTVTSSGAAGTGTSSTDTTATATGTGTTTGTGSGTAATGTSQTATTAGTSGSHGAGGKGQKGSGLPAAPAGLGQTAGYGAYERCQGTCTGAVPAALRRPLKLPADDGGPCPITLNPQPASPRDLPAGLGFRSVSGSQWLIAEVTWTVPGGVTGPLLIRGGMLGGGGAIGFGTGAVPYDELQLLDAGRGAPRVVAGGRAWITDSRVRSGGCYAYQVDGTGFSETVVFRAVA